MLRYTLRRLPSAALILVLASILIFAIIRLVPGDPVTTLAGPDASPEVRAEIESQLGLDQSVVSQYISWIRSVLTLDLGRAFVIGGDVRSLISQGLANTLVLTTTALLVAMLIALVVSTGSVIWDKRWLNALVTAMNTLATSVPPFVTGVLSVMLLAVVFPVLPAGGTPPDGYLPRLDITVQYLVLPAVCLALPVASALTRFLTESLRGQLTLPYVATARALGISRRRIVLRQVLRNALPPAVTVLGLQVGGLLGGAVLVEAIFAWPGLGQLIATAIGNRDYPVVQVLLLFSVAVFVLIQLLTDLVHAWLDPRVRLGGAAA